MLRGEEFIYILAYILEIDFYCLFRLKLLEITIEFFEFILIWSN